MSTNGISIPKTINPDLQKERNAATFDTEDFAVWWCGGKEKLKFKRYIESYIYDDMDENSKRFQDLSHEDIYTTTIHDFLRLAKKLRKLQEELNPGGDDIWPTMMINPIVWGAIPAGNPFAVHFAMVVDCIRKQGTDEQFEKFGKAAQELRIGGAYAQTELGHGTYLKGLETRADFNRETDEFILNTPTISSYKWWPGGLGQSANFCIVVANLYIDGSCKGVAMFLVPLRDEKTHMPLPGIDIGDIGKRMGFAGVNNGYLGLKNVRIPRTNMLMRNAKVHRDGTFEESPASVLTYFTMVFARCFIVNNISLVLSKSATIATRYSAVRRQSPINPKDPEPQIIDHVTQQKKLFPEIANCIAYKLASEKLFQMYQKTSEEIQQGEFASLPEIHVLSCAMKVLCSKTAMAGTETLRLACGGHGYLASSNLGYLYSDATASCTYEGENTVLLLQVARFLMKSYKQAVAGKPVLPSVTYLQEAFRQKYSPKWTGSWENLIEILQFTSANKTRLAYENLEARLKAGQSPGEANNNTGIELTQAAELHGICFVTGTFLEEVTGPKAQTRKPEFNEVLGNLLELFLLTNVQQYMNEVLRAITITDAELRDLQTRLENVLRKIRPNAVAICDGFDHHDQNLCSTLGSYDGNVYERIFAEAKLSPLNKKPVPEVFHSHMLPFMKSNL
ncbi:probable peroxisomal acyl-coenzyme A oxidase 1 [Musca vetustissima]|uniref:probable peroxisomal acyl-coenzyme A oxidase 1 n=1 Tax=Musca vetustissima TaxID=27455 RepID=UPI002AB7C31B|nr:probable peroxisomal acyl-coenzyme A oxidase 1 [Musca vetustissima]